MWLPPDFANILPELKAIPNWVLAKAVTRDGKVTKPPFRPDGRPAKSNDPSTWSTYPMVKNAYKAGGFIGVGFVLDGKPHFGGKYLHGFDWDNCVDANRAIDPEVQKVLDNLQIPRIEISVSGTGLRGFFLHDALIKSCRTQIEGRSVEMYSDTRYLTTTGIGWGALS